MAIDRIAWFDAEEWEKKYLEKIYHGFEIEFFQDSLNSDTVEKAEGFDAVTVFVSSQVGSEVVKKLDVEMIGCRSTGFNHVDLEEAKRQNIQVCNVPEYGATTVAEHTFGLILAVSRRIHEAISKVEEGEFDHAGLRGFDLEEKTLGVIGTGSIGKEVIRIADGFNMEVIASDPYPDKDAEKEMPFMYVSRQDLLEKSDIVTLHCPLTDETRHMISGEQFEIMDGGVLINTARGELVDTEALLKALENGKVSRAGLDVLEEECIIEEDIEMLVEQDEECDPRKILEGHALMERDDVIVTPHNAFNSREALERIEEQTIENLKERKNIVNN